MHYHLPRGGRGLGQYTWVSAAAVTGMVMDKRHCDIGELLEVCRSFPASLPCRPASVSLYAVYCDRVTCRYATLSCSAAAILFLRWWWAGKSAKMASTFSIWRADPSGMAVAAEQEGGLLEHLAWDVKDDENEASPCSQIPTADLPHPPTLPVGEAPPPSPSQGEGREAPLAPRPRLGRADMAIVHYSTVYVFVEDWLGPGSSTGAYNAVAFSFLTLMCLASSCPAISFGAGHGGLPGKCELRLLLLPCAFVSFSFEFLSGMFVLTRSLISLSISVGGKIFRAEENLVNLGNLWTHSIWVQEELLCEKCWDSGVANMDLGLDFYGLAIRGIWMTLAE
ncbi:hypothetical protein Taro_009835 [Colocasia esculenta]|uniref:Uncharacterized protein n=1 Tax=Colocasia esculenta TaxID=4460 RepID=A0A843U574_COLES|nr:hypothetical protein [Colocasia esculenta]